MSHYFSGYESKRVLQSSDPSFELPLDGANFSIVHRCLFVDSHDDPDCYMTEKTEFVQFLIQDFNSDFFFITFEYRDLSFDGIGTVPAEIDHFWCQTTDGGQYCKYDMNTLAGALLLRYVGWLLNQGIMVERDIQQYVGYDDYFIGYRETEAFALREQEDGDVDESWVTIDSLREQYPCILLG